MRKGPSPLPYPDHAVQRVVGVLRRPRRERILFQLSGPIGGRDMYEGGWIRIRLSSEDVLSYPIVGNDRFTVIARGRISKRLANQAAGKSAHIFDDDKPNYKITRLPKFDLVNQSVKKRFKPAYVMLVDVNSQSPKWNKRKLVAFRLNLDAWSGWSTLSAARDLYDEEMFWVQLIVSSYQPWVSADGDPDSWKDRAFYEDRTRGVTWESKRGYSNLSAIFLETIRDTPTSAKGTSLRKIVQDELDLIVAHETGHPPGLFDEEDDHAEGKLMAKDIDAAIFAYRSLDRFRRTSKWYGELVN